MGPGQDTVDDSGTAPRPPAGTSRPSVRAGSYATYQGTTYGSNAVVGSPIWLRLPRSAPRPPGFVEGHDGRWWVRNVERSELSATFYVRTTARWKGRLVHVNDVDDDTAYIRYWGPDLDGRPELTLDPGSFWVGRVPLTSLTDVREVVLDRDVRAGRYAVVDGMAYQATVHPDGTVFLSCAPGQPAPADPLSFGTYGGTHLARVPRARVSRLFQVETWALLRERHPVLVDQVHPDGTAVITLPLHAPTPVGDPVRGEIPPEVSGRPGEDWFFGSADLDELSNVHQEVRDEPAEGPPASPRRAAARMRAGQYAVVDGVEYEAMFRVNLDKVVLVLAPGQPPPAGVVARPYYDGTPQAEVTRSRVSRLFEVETWALLHGRFPVKVDRIDPDGRTAVAMSTLATTPVGTPVQDGKGHAIVPPDLSGHPAEGWLFGGPRLDELTDFHQTVREVEF